MPSAPIMPAYQPREILQMPLIRFWFALTAIALLFTAHGVVSAEYRIGVLAKNGPAKAMKKWNATAQYLTEQIPGGEFLIVPLDFDEVFPAVEKGEVHFFLVNSSMFVTAKVKYGAHAIATMINSRQGKPLKSFGGVIFTYVTSDGINNLADIKGKRFMAVKDTSFGGWQMAYKEFQDQGIDPKVDFASLEFGGKHDNVVYAVQNGEVDAGTVRTDTLERMAAAGDIDIAEFKIIDARSLGDFPFVLSTTLYPEWPFAMTVTTPEVVAQQVVEVLTAMPADSPAAKAAKVVGWTRPLDYAPVQALQQSLKIGAFE